MKRKKLAAIGASLAIAGMALTGCVSQADRASVNISKGADNFEINRRVVFVNGITDKYLLAIEGRCSIHKDNEDNQLEVTCKIGEDAYKKHYLGVSDNVTYFAEQLEPADVSVYHYRVILKPETLLPSVELDMGDQ